MPIFILYYFYAILLNQIWNNILIPPKVTTFLETAYKL